MLLVLPRLGLGVRGSERGGFYSNLGKTWAVLDSRNVLLLLEGGAGDIEQRLLSLSLLQVPLKDWGGGP